MTKGKFSLDLIRPLHFLPTDHIILIVYRLEVLILAGMPTPPNLHYDVRSSRGSHPSSSSKSTRVPHSFAPSRRPGSSQTPGGLDSAQTSRPSRSSRPSRPQGSAQTTGATDSAKTSRPPRFSRRSRPSSPTSTNDPSPAELAYRASEPIRGWTKKGAPKIGTSTVGSTGPPRRERPRRSEFEIVFRDGVPDANGDIHRQVTVDFLLSAKGEAAPTAHKTIAEQFWKKLRKKIPPGEANSRSGKSKSVLEYNNAIELHPNVKVISRPKGIVSEVTDGYQTWISVGPRNAWESVKA